MNAKDGRKMLDAMKANGLAMINHLSDEEISLSCLSLITISGLSKDGILKVIQGMDENEMRGIFSLAAIKLTEFAAERKIAKPQANEN